MNKKTRNTGTEVGKSTIALAEATPRYANRLIVISCIVAIVVSLLSVHFGTQANLKKSCESVTAGFASIMESYKHSFELFEVILQQKIISADSIDELEGFMKEQDNNLLNIEGADYDGVYMYYKGRYLYSWDTPYSVYADTGYDATMRPWYIGAVKADGEIFFSTPYPSYANDYMLATISRLQDDGETVIAYDIKLGEIGKYVDALDIYNGALALICDDNGNIIGSTNHLYQGGNYTYSEKMLNQSVSNARQELVNADDAKEKANAEKKLESAKALSEYGAGRFNFLKNLLSGSGTLKYSLARFSFGYACESGTYTCFVIVPITSLLPNMAIQWAAFSFIFSLAAYIALKMVSRSHQIVTDALTGLNNRRAFANYCTNHLRHHTDESLGLIVLDLQHFKKINDTYGHLVGDRALHESALILKDVCELSQNEWFLCRYGGDEFLLALKKCKPKDLDIMKALINDGFEKSNQTNNREYQLAVSGGSSYGICSDRKSLETLISKADKAMYEEKNQAQ